MTAIVPDPLLPDESFTDTDGTVLPVFSYSSDATGVPLVTETATATLVPASEADIMASLTAAVSDGGDIAAYSVNGRTTQLRSLSELIAAHKYYSALAARKSGLRRTRVSFG